MWPFTAEEFWLSLWSNALADLFVGVILGTLFATIIGKWIASRSVANLYLHSENPETGHAFTSPLRNWPPTEDCPAHADFQLRIENQGTIAAVNWLVTLEFAGCRSWQNTPLIELRVLESQADTHGPVVEVRHESRNDLEFLRFQYASPSDMIHSGYKQFAPANLRFGVLFHHGMSFIKRDRRSGRYKIYADHMETKTGEIGLTIDAGEQEASLHFNLWG